MASITVHARGKTGTEKIEFRASGFAAERRLSTDLDAYTEVWPQSALDTFEVAFTNDSSSGPEGDRTVYLERIMVTLDDGSALTIQGDDPGIYSTGTHTSPGGCDGGFKQIGRLDCNGSMEFGPVISALIGGGTTPIDPPVDPPPEDWGQRLNELEATIDYLTAELRVVRASLVPIQDRIKDLELTRSKVRDA